MATSKKRLSKENIKKQLAIGAIFILAALGLAHEVPTLEIAWVGSILLLTIYLFAFEVVAVDVAAITIMVVLGLTSLLAPLMGLEKGLVPSEELFKGFSSNAVMSIVAVMIVGAGLDKTGLMSKAAAFILQVGGSSEKRIIPIISGTVALISSFMQNVGAAALFLPVVSRISARTGLPMSRLLMPMGFCAILGGTVTMVGSSPLILLNDLILASNRALPADSQMQTWSIFSVTPIGLALVITGIIYFIVAGRFVLPVNKGEGGKKSASKYLEEVYGINYDIYELDVPKGSSLIGKRLDDFETASSVRVIANRSDGKTRSGPGSLDRDTTIEAGMILGIVSSPDDVKRFTEAYQLNRHLYISAMAETLSPSKSGIAEVVIPPASQLIGKSARDVWMRKSYGISMVGLHRDGETMREGQDIRSIPLHAGDTLVVHTTWEALARLEKDRNFVVITTEFPHEELRPQKVGWAALLFVLTLSLILFTDIRLSIALMTGAIGMVLTGVLKMEEAYEAVSWKTVFLLASLIPLGLAVETSGTAKWIADVTLTVVGHMPVWIIQTAVAILATFFTLVMSNVGATVLLVPLAVNIAIGVGANPAVFALTVALATSNSFIIPTHQVNALIMSPAGYRVPDFVRAGGIMTVLFIIVLIVMMSLIYG
jgi:di/tricarboxylate transporter